MRFGFLLAILVCLAPAVLPAQTDLTLHGTATAAQSGTYLHLPFTVPAGTERVTVSFSYDRDHHATLDLGLNDPTRFRGWSGGNKLTFTVGIADSTPSYLPGPIPPGTWHLIVGVAYLEPGQQTTFTAHIHLTPVGSTNPTTFTDAPLASGPHWFRGDLHMHTAHSDGSCPSQTGNPVPCPVFVTLQQAAARHLDFIAVTDHNTESHYDAERELQPFFDKLLLLPGRELTTYFGHANLFGTTSYVPFEVTKAGRASLFTAAHRLGAFISVNHPVATPGQICIGCAWQMEGFDISLADGVEVINGDDPALHEADLAFYEQQLHNGHHLVALGGSDTHRPLTPGKPFGGIGVPTTVVYAEELSVPSVLAGMRSGHVFIDVEGTADRLLTASATSAGATASMGDSLHATVGGTAQLTAHVEHCPGARLVWFLDGALFKTTDLGPAASSDTETDLNVTPGAHTAHPLVRDAEGHLLLVGNPIYINAAR